MKTKQNLEKILAEKNEIQNRNLQKEHLRELHHRKMQEARKRLNHEIFELQKEFLQKIAEL